MSYIICFWDKSKLQVTDEVGEKLKEAIRTESIKTFELGSSMYAVGGVEKIIPKEEAYNTFPEQWEQFKQMEDKKPNAETLKALGGETKFLT